MKCQRLHRNAKPFDWTLDIGHWTSDIRHWWHRLWCAECREASKADVLIARGVAQMQAEPVPPDGLARTLAAWQMRMPTTTVANRVNVGEILKTRQLRWTGVVAMAAAIIAVFWLTSRPNQKGAAALAQVLEEMAKVRSLHITGWSRTSLDGEMQLQEVWFKSPDKYRNEVGGRLHSGRNGRDVWHYESEGTRFTPILDPDGRLSWVLGPFDDKGPSCWHHYFADRIVFGPVNGEWLLLPLPKGREIAGGFWEDAVGTVSRLIRQAQRKPDMARVNEYEQVGTDGKKARVFEFISKSPVTKEDRWKEIIFIDPETWRVVKVESYLTEGGETKLHYRFDKFEYDIDIPDDLFTPPTKCGNDCLTCKAREWDPRKDPPIEELGLERRYGKR